MDENVINKESTDNNYKERNNLLLLTDVLSQDNLNIETLNRIRFFIINNKTNPQSFKVDIQKNIFYNVETNEVYEVIKNESTNEYEIIRHDKAYENNQEYSQETTSNGLGIQKSYTRVRKIEKKPYINNAAFTKVSFLVMNILTVALLIAMIILLNK